jgi:hypothetical protein
MDTKGKFFQPMAELVAGGSTIKNACQQCGCSERQGYRLSGDPSFRSFVSGLRTQSVSDAIGLLSQASRTAVQRLILLTDSDDPSVALRACTAILDRFTSLSEHVDLRSRVEALEKERQS